MKPFLLVFHKDKRITKIVANDEKNRRCENISDL